MKFFRFLRTSPFYVLTVSTFTFGCTNGNTISPDSKPQDPTSQSPTQGTSIYRYLSAISDAYPDNGSLTSLCIRQHGFKLELPKQGIKSTHDISLPASEEWSEIQQIETQRYRTERIQPPSVNGIIKQPAEKQVPYNATENVVVTKSIRGTCIGTEYILN